jgi:hypothetical protein
VPRPGRPKTVTTPEIIDEIYEPILEDWQISDKQTAEQLNFRSLRSISQKLDVLWSFVP